MEACGPHQAPAKFHHALQTAKLGDPIHTISFDRVLTEAFAVVEASLARTTSVPSP